jgi:MFS family permease
MGNETWEMEKPKAMSPEPEDNPRYEGWRVAVASGGGIFTASLLVYTFGIFLRPLSQEFGWSREAVSSAYGITAVMSAAFAAPLGYLFDRLGPRRVLLPCAVLFGSLFASLGVLTQHLWHFYIVFALLGIVATGMSPIAYARAISSWFERRRGMAIAVAMCGGALGAVVHPPVAQALTRLAGWRTACVILGAIAVGVSAPVLARFVRERPSAETGHSDGSATAGVSVRDGLRSRVFWILVVVLFGTSIAQNGAIVHMFALLTDRGVPANSAAFSLSALGAAAIAGRLATGWLLDHFFAARVGFALLTIAALGTFLLSSAASLATGVVAAVLIGFGVGGESDVTPYLLSRYFGLRSFSLLYGFTWIATASAGAAGPILMGRAFDLTGSYEILLVRLSIGMVAVASLMFAMPRYDYLEKPETVLLGRSPG